MPCRRALRKTNESLLDVYSIRLPVTLLGVGETLTQFSPCRLQLYTRAAPTSSLRPLRWKTWFVLSIATALPAGSNARKYAVESKRFGPVRFQFPVNVETGLTLSSEPVPKKTPPAENEAKAVKETGLASTEKIHDPSIGNVMPPAFSCTSACAMAVEFRIGTARPRMVKVLNRLTVLCLIAVMFLWVIMSFSFEFEIQAALSLILEWEVSTISPTLSAQLRSSVGFEPTLFGVG
jgi:hypothetical protein